MKKIFFIFLFVLMLSASVDSQFQIGNRNFKKNGSSCSPFTDSFSGSGALSGNWTNVPSLSAGATIVQASGVAESSGAFNNGVAIVTGCTPSATPYAQVTISNLQATVLNQVGLMVRSDSLGNGYQVTYVYGSTSAISKCTSGSCSYEATTSCSFGNGSVIKFSASGTTTVVLTAYVGGVSCGTWTDTSSTYTTGFDGLQIGDNTATTSDVTVSSFQAN